MSEKIPVVWLLVAPLTAAFTVDDIPNINRSIAMAPMFDIIAAVGLIFMLEKIHEKARGFALAFVLLLFIFNTMYFLHQYFVHAKVHRNWYRNVGVQEAMGAALEVYNDYDNILVTKNSGGIYPLVLFYSKYDPRVYQSEGSPKDREYTHFGKFFFVPQACPAKDRDSRFPKGKTLYIESGECENIKNVASQNYILGQDDTKVFHLVYE